MANNYCSHLKTANGLAKLLSLKQIRQCIVKYTLRQSNHLSSNTDSSFIKNFNRIFIALSDISKDIFDGYLENLYKYLEQF